MTTSRKRLRTLRGCKHRTVEKKLNEMVSILRYPCSSCDGRFLLPSHLRAHVESRHCEAKRSDDSRVPQCSQLDNGRSHVLGDNCSGSAGKPSTVSCSQPVPDHDYSRCADPESKSAFMEVFECLECSSFFASFESLRRHTHTEHKRNETVDDRNLRSPKVFDSRVRFAE